MASHSRTEQPDFIRRQYEFAAHIRDPDNQPAPEDIEDRRMGIYRELFFNNVESFIAGTFPVLRKILDDKTWHALIRDYFSRHKSRTPLFLEMPREFLTWLESERDKQDGDLPFLRELAHYEWVELALSIAEESLDGPAIDGNGDLMKGIPVLSPLAWHLAYNYPVHRIGPDFLPDSPGDSPTFLVVYRDRDNEVGFLEINPVTKRLLELVDEDSGETGEALLSRIARELNHPDPGVVIKGGEEILRNMKQKDIILGTRQP
ncbi:MAG: putative DNA-binding domain-containing protein [Gammaproteobacteria bacterium]|nr:MAG: putative DNA-binding domain-containing protein [Gammaproteobacteria bacterium]